MAKEKTNFDINESDLPESIPVIPINVQLEREKEERRKLEKQLRDKGKQPEPIITTQSGKTKLASQLTPKEREIEIIRCATDAIYFIKTYLTIFDQTKGGGGQIIFFDLFPFQVNLIKNYQEHRFVVANKYRQAGISTATCAFIAWYVMFNENRSVAIVADKLETAINELMNDVVDFIDSCPKWLRPSPTSKDTQKLKRYDNGCQLSAFSSKGLRGYTPTLLFWDETAWTEKGDKFWTSASPTLQTGGRAIFVSTPAGLDPVFYKTFTAAKRKENNFKAVELWWFNDPRYNKDLVWIKNKEKENEIIMPDEGWSDEHRIKLQDDGWEANSPWLEEQIRQANGDMKKVAQEILCVFGDSIITVRHKKTKQIINIRIDEFYELLAKNDN